MSTQFRHAESVDFSADHFRPTKHQQAYGLLCTKAGTAILDVPPFNGHDAATVSIAMLAGQQLELMFTRIDKGSSGAFVALY